MRGTHTRASISPAQGTRAATEAGGPSRRAVVSALWVVPAVVGVSASPSLAASVTVGKFSFSKLPNNVRPGRPIGTFSVTATLPNGRPAAGAQVTITVMTNNAFFPNGATQMTFTANSQGVITVSGLVAGNGLNSPGADKIIIRASAPGAFMDEKITLLPKSADDPAFDSVEQGQEPAADPQTEPMGETGQQPEGEPWMNPEPENAPPETPAQEQLPEELNAPAMAPQEPGQPEQVPPAGDMGQPEPQ